MIQRYYAEVDASGDIIQTLIVNDPDEGPPQMPETNLAFYPVPGPLDWTPPTETSIKKWVDGADVWVETDTLPGLKASAIAKTYKDVDAIYDDAIGRRATEYTEAEKDARAFKAAGYTGPVSEYVSDYALYNPTGAAQSNQWAADVIIARADAFAMAQRLMRSTRFASQAQMQAASTIEDLNTATTTWRGFIATLRGQLGL